MGDNPLSFQSFTPVIAVRSTTLPETEECVLNGVQYDPLALAASDRWCTDGPSSGFLHGDDTCFREVVGRSFGLAMPAGQQICFRSAGGCYDSPDVVAPAAEKASDGTCSMLNLSVGFNIPQVIGHGLADVVPWMLGSAIGLEGHAPHSRLSLAITACHSPPSLGDMGPSFLGVAIAMAELGDDRATIEATLLALGASTLDIAAVLGPAAR